MKNLLAVILSLFFLEALGQVPSTLSYQGILMQQDGITPLADGQHSIIFSFYTQASGGTALFTRTVNVTTVKGLFTCIIGDGSANNAALPSTVGASQIYIGLRVDGGTELSPRTRLTAAPYAFAVAPNDSGPGPVPSGGIIMWSGPVNAIPQGYVLCDGSNGTPDLRGRFIVGYHAGDSDYNAIGKTGGLKTVTLTIAQMPSHNHGGNTGSTNRRTNHWRTTVSRDVIGANSQDVLGWNSSDEGHNHSISSQGGGEAHENRPPYFVLAFIMKK
jgi:hypothetical protein